MLHGAPSDSRIWQWMLPDLSRDHTVVVWDAPGFGESSDIDVDWRATRFADALAAFIAAVDLERPHLVGQGSFGTMVALSTFQRHPALPASPSCSDRVATAVLGRVPWPPVEVVRRLEQMSSAWPSWARR